MTDKNEQGIYAAMPRILTIISAAKRVMENGHGHEDEWKAEFLSAAKDGELTIHDYCSGPRVEPILFSKVKTEEFQRYLLKHHGHDLLVASRQPDTIVPQTKAPLEQTTATDDAADGVSAIAVRPIRKRPHFLAHLISQAEKRSSDPTDANAVMEQLIRMVESKQSPLLVGVVPGGVQYKDTNDDVKEFSRKALSAYLRGDNLTRNRPRKSA
jgi:hypothetical protein